MFGDEMSVTVIWMHAEGSGRHVAHLRCVTLRRFSEEVRFRAESGLLNILFPLGVEVEEMRESSLEYVAWSIR